MQPDRFSAPSFAYEPRKRFNLRAKLALMGEIIVWAPALMLAAVMLFLMAIVSGAVVAP